MFQTKAQTTKILDEAESQSGWSTHGKTNSLTLDFADFKQGKASLQAEGEGIIRFTKKWDNPINTGITDVSKGVLSFWYFISDASLIGNGSVEISSSGKSDLAEYSWTVQSLKLKNGWNQMTLKLSKAGKTDGDVDLSAINFIRIYHNCTGSVVTKIDDIKFSNLDK